MPEGDTLHRTAAQLQVLVGERVEAVAPHPRGAATGVAAAVDGRRLERVEAVGKNLLLQFEGGLVVRSHLRMSGRWRVEPRGAERSGKPWLVLRGGEWEAVQWNGPVLTLGSGGVDALGPDVLADGVGPETLVRAVRRTDQRRAVGEVLLDQHVVSGIGTMWLAELLWQARLSPWQAVGGIDDHVLHEALARCRSTMRAAVSGIRPLRSVYGRGGRACPRCATPITFGRVGDSSRAVFWCPHCQST